MKKMLEYLPTGVVVFEAQEPYKAIYVNEAFLQHVGITAEEMLRTDVSDYERGIYQEDRYSLAMARYQAKKQRHSKECECRMLSKDGTYRWYAFCIRYVEDMENEPVYIMAVWDIDDRKQVEEELYVQTERYKLMEMISGELPFDYDVEKKELLISAKYLAMRGKTNVPEYFVKDTEMEDICYGPDMAVFRQAMEQASAQEKSAEMELRINISSEPEKAEYAWYRLLYKGIPGMSGKIVRIVGRMTNINQEKMERYWLSERVKREPLTGLLNKQATKEVAESFLQASSGQEHAIIVIDIDNFKNVNDNFGHLFGDTVLIGIAEKITAAFRKDDIVGRVGGDEFLVLMKNIDYQDVAEKVEFLCQELKQKYHGGEQEVIISSSVGIAFFEKDGTTYEELFEKADYAMYQAKAAGKNQYRFAEARSQIAGLRKRNEGECRGSRRHTGVQDESFLSSAFFLLAHAKSVNISMNILLERIGQRYSLDVVAILEDGEEPGTFVQTNCWKKNTGIVANPTHIGNYEEWKLYMSGFDERGILCVDDYDAQSKPEQQIYFRSGRRIGALMNCRFECQNGRGGMITFCHMEKQWQWSEFEKETFLEIAKIISVFVSVRNNQIENQNTIQSLKSRDPLTGLLNDKTFREEVKKKLVSGEGAYQFAIIYTDIRDFSYVNENFGIEAGNQILREFAAAVSTAPKVMSCRLHSDLFVSLVWDDSKEQIVKVVEKTVNDFTQMQKKNYPRGNLRLVAGIYFIDSADEDIDTAIENANLTRKRIKSTTGGSVCQVYTEDLRVGREQEKRIISEFEETLTEERFLVYVQPKFQLETMEMRGGEALVRWQRRDGTMEYPNVFIPVLEKSGFIVNLDFYVFEQVLKYQQKWKEQGKELCRISVNFSRKHFEGEGIYKRVSQLTEKYGIEPKYVEIEITESLLMAGLDMVRTEMRLLRSAGFTVAIDDFGTGYSSLSMLHDIPADIVKIDKSFLDKSDMEREKEFIEKIGALIRSVKEEVIFEGIETKQQLEFLVDCGFRYGQGYLYDRPLPIEVFEEKYIR